MREKTLYSDEPLDQALADGNLAKPTEWFCKYRRPVEILEALEFWRGKRRLAHFFNDPKLKKLHEAWIMAYAGMAHEVLEEMEAGVCVVNEQGTWVDGRVQTSACVTEYQITIVNRRPDRAVGHEYRQLAEVADDAFVRSPYRPLSIKEVSRRVREEVHRKAQKHYAGRPNLLLYVNLQEIHGYSFQQMTVATRHLADKFESIWVLCGLVPACHPGLAQNAYRYAPLPEGYGFIRLHPLEF